MTKKEPWKRWLKSTAPPIIHSTLQLARLLIPRKCLLNGHLVSSHVLGSPSQPIFVLRQRQGKRPV